MRAVVTVEARHVDVDTIDGVGCILRVIVLGVSVVAATERVDRAHRLVTVRTLGTATSTRTAAGNETARHTATGESALGEITVAGELRVEIAHGSYPETCTNTEMVPAV